jgi:gluconolactonase
MTAAEFEILDDRFRPCVRTSARVEHLYEGCRWAEGPAYFPAHHSLVWSDIPNDRMLRFDEMTGAVGIFRAPANYANGNTIDRQGRLVTCEHGGRRVTRTEHDGAITVLADRFEGNRLNSPNDLVVQSNGAIWFTDPSYGIDSNYEGNQAPREQDGCHVYRIDPATGDVERVLDDFVRPNGLAFSPDETRLYVADSGGTSVKDGPRHIRAFTLDDRRLTGGDVFATCTHGLFDGFRVDESGRIWAGTQQGVHCFDRSGDLIGKIRVPETVANVTFGGPKRNRLYLCATTSLYAVFVAVSGAKTM